MFSFLWETCCPNKRRLHCSLGLDSTSWTQQLRLHSCLSFHNALCRKYIMIHSLFWIWYKTSCHSVHFCHCLMLSYSANTVFCVYLSPRDCNRQVGSVGVWPLIGCCRRNHRRAAILAHSSSSFRSLPWQPRERDSMMMTHTSTESRNLSC